jgi:hypothetical protein
MAAPCSLTLISPPPLLSFTALFSIVNPLSGAFIFFGATRCRHPCSVTFGRGSKMGG